MGATLSSSFVKSEKLEHHEPGLVDSSSADSFDEGQLNQNEEVVPPEQPAIKDDKIETVNRVVISSKPVVVEQTKREEGALSDSHHEEKSTMNETMIPVVDSNRTMGQPLEDKSIAHTKWQEAASALKKNPELVTPDMLKLALKNHSPFHVVQLMLKLNPKAASVPKNGPSALQVGVRSNASIETIEEVIRACPFALFSSNGTYDPLTYAKIWRRKEQELIDLLSKPLSHWVVTDEKVVSGSEQQFERSKPTSKSMRRLPSSLKHEKVELDNIKRIAAAIIRAQKKHTVAARSERDEIHAEIKGMEAREKTAREEQLEKIATQEKQHFGTQLVAIDMKTQAFESKLTFIGEQVIDAVKASTKKTEQVVQDQEARQDELIRRLEEKLTFVRDDIASSNKALAKKVEVSDFRIDDLAIRLDRETMTSEKSRNESFQRIMDLEHRFNAMLASHHLLQGTSPFYPQDPEIWSQQACSDQETVPLFMDEFGSRNVCKEKQMLLCGSVVCGKSIVGIKSKKEKQPKKSKKKKNSRRTIREVKDRIFSNQI
eukprot:scaffold49056_cov47-Attheya_sp.AAC.2